MSQPYVEIKLSFMRCATVVELADRTCQPTAVALYRNKMNPLIITAPESIVTSRPCNSDGRFHLIWLFCECVVLSMSND